MVRDTRSAGKIRNRVDDNSLKKKLNGEKDVTDCSSGKAEMSSSGRNIPNHQSLRSLKQPEKGTSPSASPAVRKSGRLENRSTTSPLRRSDRGKNSVSSSFSDFKQTAKVLSFSEEKRKKEKKEKNIQAVMMESGKAQVELETVGGKRKKMTGHTFRKRFKSHCPEDIVPDITGAIERPGKLCEDKTIMDNVVDEPLGGDGFKDTQTILNVKDTLCDNKRLAIESESSTSLARSQDCGVHSDSGGKPTRPEDVDGAIDGPDKLSADSLIMDNGGNVPKDSRTGREPKSLTCSARSQDGPVNTGTGDKCPDANPPTSESENHSLSVICVLCSKRKRVSCDSPENEFCSCVVAPVHVIVCGLPACKDRGDCGTAATSESAERGLPREPHSDNHQMDSHVNACANCSDPLCCDGKGSKRCPRFIADGKNSRFLEYWLPVQISNHQLEQYCATLLSNSIPLRSCSKNDNCGALQEILRTVKKCCTHPYLVDSSAQDRFIAEGHLAPEVLEIGVEASGKLHLLDKMLTQIKARGSQVLILFQLIVGSGKASTGDILDDFLRQRFGEYSYERVEATVNSSKKQAAVNRFNRKEAGKFVFLLENRACSVTIKLLSLDTIIIFDSDWNPVNDFRALQKISIDSRVEKIKVFRLYSSFTFEERALLLAKKNVNIENSLQTSSRATIDSLLMWGALYLFSKLDDYHAESTSALNTSSGQLLLTKVMQEFQSILSESYENSDSTSFISEVKLDVGGYKANITLLGEAKVELKEGEEAHVFWKNLLDRKIPQWKHLVAPSPRNRKRVQYFDKLPGKPDTKNDDAGKKRKKVVNGNADLASIQVDVDAHQETRMAGPDEGTSNQTQYLGKIAVTSNNNANGMSNPISIKGSGVDALDAEGRIALSDEQKSLHSFLEGEIMKLCHILKLSEDVTHTVKRFLEYIIKNHHVSSDPQEIVQAFQISLCWIASSILKQRVDKKLSLSLAKQSLSYQCTEEQAISVYLKMRSLKKMYLQWLENSIDSVREILLAEEDIGEPFNLKEAEFLLDQRKALKDNSPEDDIENQIEKKCYKRLKKLRRKQLKKIQEIYGSWEKKRLKLVEDHKLEAAFIRSLHDVGSVRTEKLKRCEDAFAKKIDEHNLLREAELKVLEAEQLAAIKVEKQRADCWLAEAKTCLTQSGVFNGPQLLSSQHEGEAGCSFTAEKTAIDAANLVSMSSQHEEYKSMCTQRTDVSPPITSAAASVMAVECNVTIDSKTSSNLLSNNSENESLMRSSPDVDEPLKLPSSREGVSGEAQPVEPNKEVPEEVPETVSNENVLQDRVPQSSLEPHVENVLIVGNQQISDIEASAIAPADTVTATQSNVHLQDQDTPAVEKPTTVQVANPEHVDIVSSVQIGVAALVDTVTSTESAIELQAKDAPAVQHQTTVQMENPVEPIMEQPNRDALEVENRGAPLSEVATLVNIKRADHLSVEVPSCHQIVETEVLSHDPISVSSVELPNQAVLQLGVGSSYLSHPATQQVAFHLGQTFIPEPLLFEFENLRKEKEILKKNHDDSASQMKSDCDKEIAKAIQEIRSKYEMKLREAEVEFKLKKNELERKQNKVLVNRKLAESFRSKCLDGRPTWHARVQQQGNNRHSYVQQSVQPPVRLQQLHQQSLLPSVRLPAGPSSFQLSPRQQIASPVEQSHVQQQQQQALLQDSMRPPPVSNVGSVVPPTVLTVQHKAAAAPPRFSSTPPSRPLIISSHTPSGNPGNSGNIRAPPPHLQRFRPVAAVSTPPHLQAQQIPSPQQTSRPEGGLPVHANSSPQQQLSTSRPEASQGGLLVHANSPSNSLPETSEGGGLPVHANSSSQQQPLISSTSRPEGGFPVQGNSSLSALELLMNVDQQSRTIPPLTEIYPAFTSLEPSELRVLGSSNIVEANPTTSSVAAQNDVVCLSDDE